MPLSSGSKYVDWQVSAYYIILCFEKEMRKRVEIRSPCGAIRTNEPHSTPFPFFFSKYNAIYT